MSHELGAQRFHKLTKNFEINRQRLYIHIDYMYLNTSRKKCFYKKDF
jgi:hypothetical protein